jgi:phosphoribosyl-AMP cyclohydrolase
MKKLLTALVISCLSLSAQAGLSMTDWKNPGDNAVVTDSDTGIEWLRLIHTNRYSINGVLAEMGKGGKFEGFRLPTANEVGHFMATVYMTTEATLEYHTKTYRSGHYLGRAQAWAWWMSNNSRNAAHHRGIYLDHDNTTVRLAGSYLNNNDYSITYGLAHGGAYNKDTSIGGTVGGVFLVSDGGTTYSSINNPQMNANNPAAPINANGPLSAFAAGLALMGFGLRRRQR